MRQLTLFLLLLTLCNASSAKLYKWVDANGNVTYSERKPADKEAEEIKLRGVSAVSNEQAQARIERLRDAAETSRKDREFKQSAARESAEHSNQLAENCAASRKNMQVLQNAPRVKATDGTVLDDSARAARVAQTQKEIDANCK